MDALLIDWLQLNVKCISGLEYSSSSLAIISSADGRTTAWQKEPLDGKNQLKLRFLSGHERHLCLFCQAKGIL